MSLNDCIPAIKYNLRTLHNNFLNSLRFLRTSLKYETDHSTQKPCCEFFCSTYNGTANPCYARIATLADSLGVWSARR